MFRVRYYDYSNTGNPSSIPGSPYDRFNHLKETPTKSHGTTPTHRPSVEQSEGVSLRFFRRPRFAINGLLIAAYHVAIRHESAPRMMQTVCQCGRE